MKGKKARKVLFICTWFPNRVYPKNGNFIQRHAKLVAQFIALTVLNVQEDPALPSGQLQTVVAQELGYKKIIVYYGKSQFGIIGKAWQILRAYYTGVVLADGIRAYHLLHAHITLHAGIVAAILNSVWKIPYIISEHSSYYLEKNAAGIMAPLV